MNSMVVLKTVWEKSDLNATLGNKKNEDSLKREKIIFLKIGR